MPAGLMKWCLLGLGAATAAATASGNTPVQPAGTDAHATICNVLDFGAVGDNKTEDTAALAAAIRACAGKASVSPRTGKTVVDGGRVVLLPKNYTFLLRPVELPSHTVLHIEGDVSAWPDIASWPNSTVRQCATTPYETPLPDVVLAPMKEALFWSANATNLTISGNGVVDGAGWRWWPLRKKPGDYWHNCRPHLLAFGRYWPPPFSGVSNVLVEGITLKDSPFWTIQGRDVQGIRFDNVEVTTTGCGYGEAPNTDGFNLQGQDIEVLNCRVRNGDDCVPLFPPTRNVTVRNVSCSCGNGVVPVTWPPLSLPDAGGDIQDVIFDDIRFDHTSNAAAIKSLPSYVGTVSNVTFRNFQVRWQLRKVFCGFRAAAACVFLP
eukprot:INCI14219.3.p1 GENE.INCI14219.3~~INCI14219.3.p1  ORF type:complete len:378 (-),score=43.90 INCI14219.3:468-1601(-)